MRRLSARPLLALAVATMGVVDLLSALLSHLPERLLVLPHIALALVRAQTPGGLLSFVRNAAEVHSPKPDRRTAAA